MDIQFIPREYRFTDSMSTEPPIPEIRTLAGMDDQSHDRTEFGNRLRRARAHRGMTQKQLADQVGMSQSALAEAERSGQRSSKMFELARATGVRPEWLSAGEGPMVEASARPAGAINFNDTKVREVYVVGKGSGGLMPDRVWTDSDFPVGATDECAPLATDDKQAFLTEVEGPSMVPRYNPGEFALVEPGTEPDIEDDVLVRLTTGHTMVKRLLSRRGGWRFGSYNNAEVLFYKPEEVSWVYYIAHPVPRRKIKARC